MPADIVPGIQRVIFGGSTDAVGGSTIGPSTAALGLVVRQAALYPPVVTVRASTDFLTSAGTTTTSDVVNYGAIGALVGIDVSSVTASSAGGGAGGMTHTLQVKDPIGGTYVGTTVAVVATTAAALYMFQVYPGTATASPTSALAGRFDLALPTAWRFSSTSSSSATNWTYSISCTYLPVSGTSS